MGDRPLFHTLANETVVAILLRKQSGCSDGLHESCQGYPDDPSGVFIGADADSSLIEDGDCISAAAVLVYESRRLYCDRCHAGAFLQADSNGESIYDNDGSVDTCKLHTDLFFTKNGKVVDRMGALKFFGIVASGGITRQN